MDKTTKAFVIGACSVVIAIPVIWIGSQVNNEIQRAGEQRRRDDDRQRLRAEMDRRSSRGELCTDRLFRDDSLEEKNDPELGPAWIGACMQSRLPVDEYE